MGKNDALGFDLARFDEGARYRNTPKIRLHGRIPHPCSDVPSFCGCSIVGGQIDCTLPIRKSAYITGGRKRPSLLLVLFTVVTPERRIDVHQNLAIAEASVFVEVLKRRFYIDIVSD